MSRKVLARVLSVLVLVTVARTAAASCGGWVLTDDYTLTLSAVPATVSAPTVVKVTIHNPQTGGPAAAYTVFIDGDTPALVSNQCPSKFRHVHPGPICSDGPYPLNEGETDIYLVAVPAGTTRTITVRFTHATHGGVIEADIAYADPTSPLAPQIRTHHVFQRIACL